MESIDEIIRSIRSSNAEKRINAIFSLVVSERSPRGTRPQLHPDITRAVPALRDALECPDIFVAVHAAMILVKVPPKRNDEQIRAVCLEALKDPEAWWWGESVLQQMGVPGEGEEALQNMISLAKDQSNPLRLAAMTALGRFEPPARAAIPMLQDVERTDRDAHVRLAAGVTISQIESKSRSE